MPPASRQLSRGGQIVGCSRVEEQGAGLSRRPDAELRLRAVDVVLNGAGRDIENEPDVGEGLSLRRQSEALPFAAGQVDAGDNQKGFQLFAHLPVELISDEPQRKRVTPGGVQEGCVLFIGGEGERGKAAMPVMDRNGVTVTDTEAGGFVEEPAGEGIVASKILPPSEGMWLTDAVQHDGIAGFVTLIDIVFAPGIGIVGDQAELPAGC